MADGLSGKSYVRPQPASRHFCQSAKSSSAATACRFAIAGYARVCFIGACCAAARFASSGHGHRRYNEGRGSQTAIAAGRGQSTSMPPASVPPPIRLSMGVALPQTGPDGILMSFSVEYDRPQATPIPSRWRTKPIRRITSGDRTGACALFKQAVHLGGQNTLVVLINGWRPTDAPFTTHIEDRYGHRLSRSIDLEGPGLPPD